MLKRLFLFCFMLTACAHLFAQEAKTITGVVKDSTTGETLIGVTVVEPGTSNGTSTDIDGNYTLKVKGDKIKISYVGFKSQELIISQSGTLNITLIPDTELDEIIVVGYTSMKKRDVLGSIGKVNSKELVQMPAPGVSEALQGRISGVQVTSTTGAPGAGVSVRVRGTGSINGENDPLYIIDGIPSSNGLNSIAPSDIENISVLKDASSAAMYGSRATNGVVLVTTKKGQRGKLRVSYNGQIGFQTHTPLAEMVNTKEYIDIYNAARRNDSNAAHEFIEGANVKDFADVNHLKEIFRTAPLNVHEISISGGNEKLSYLASGSYFNQQGIVHNSGFEKFSGHTNISYQTTNWLKLGLSLNAAHAKTNSIPSSGDGFGSSEGGSVIRYAYMRNPAIPTYDKDGNYVDKPSEYYGDGKYDGFFGDGYNPLGLAKMSDRVKKSDTFFGKVDAEVKLPYTTIWRTNFGYDYGKNKFVNKDKTWGTSNRINSNGAVTTQKSDSWNWTLNSILNNIQTFDEVHNLNTMIGLEAIRESTDYNDLTVAEGKESPNGRTEASSLLSFFAKADYNFKNKYYLSALVRQDGSSRFTKGNRWGTFYSVSGGWDIHEESFMKSAKIIDLLKLRAGYGVVGNQNIGYYAYTDIYEPYSNYPFGGNPTVGYRQTTLGNDNLKWESSHQLNLGIDMAFAKGSYGFSVDYYNKVSTDMLVRASLPPSVGNANPYWINNGEVLNRGVDVEVYFRKQYKDMGFSATLNWGYLHNEVLDVQAPIWGGRVDTGVDIKPVMKRHSIGSFYLYEMDGIFQNDAEIVKSAYQGSNVKPGDVKYKDINRDGVIDDKDRKDMGTSIPKHTLGLNLSGNYKNWDMSLFFQGAFGHKIFHQIGYETEGFYRGFTVSKEYYDNYWRGEGTSNEYPRPSWSAKGNNVMASSRFLEDASYLRLKNIQVGYTFPMKSKFINRLRAYGSVTNLITFTGYKGLDPEMTVSANAKGEGDRSGGIDWGTYPVARSFTLGVNITF